MVRNNHNRGNALVIALILITIILTIALGVGYMTVAEVKMQTSLEEASIAYSAAEAGIEDGLLRWRYNHDVETVSINPAYQEQIDRVNLNDGGFQKQTVPPVPLIPPVSDASYYDLKVTYRKLTDDDPANTATKVTGTIEKDKVLELSGIPNGATLVIEFSNFSFGAIAEIKVAHATGIVESSIKDATNLFFSQSLLGDDTVKVRAWNGSVDYSIYATPPPGGPPGAPSKVAIDTGTTTIESVGYYGDSKRKLVAKIDRKNSILLGIFDMTLYSGSGSITTN